MPSKVSKVIKNKKVAESSFTRPLKKKQLYNSPTLSTPIFIYPIFQNPKFPKKIFSSPYMVERILYRPLRSYATDNDLLVTWTNWFQELENDDSTASEST